MIAKSVLVFGRVQGVGFRWHTLRRAQELDLDGWVVNRPDGSVSVHAEGEAEAVTALVSWLEHGPASASVDRIEVTDTTAEGMEGFEVRS